MGQKLNFYKLETNWDVIRQKTKGEWKRTVTEAVDKVNKEKLIQFCVTTTTTTENVKINANTKNVYKDLQSPTYTRDHLKEITIGNKQRTKTLMLARDGMLE